MKHTGISKKLKSSCYPFFFIIAICITANFSCETPVSYSDTPRLTFKSYRVRDTTISDVNDARYIDLIFKLTDGDGNVGGITEIDSTLTDIYIDAYGKTDGEYWLNEDDFPDNFNLPEDLVRTDYDKTLVATVTLGLQYTISSSKPFPYDTVQYRLYVIDNDLNESNTMITPDIDMTTLTR